MTGRRFPELTPTGRSYKPGRVSETVFTGQNGSTTFVQFGGAFVNAELELEFRNIRDSDAAAVLAHYASVVGDDYVTFNDNHGFGGIDSALQAQMADGKGMLRYRYDGPPEVVSVYPGISSVRCSFIGYLYGA